MRTTKTVLDKNAGILYVAFNHSKVLNTQKHDMEKSVCAHARAHTHLYTILPTNYIREVFFFPVQLTGN